jgi:hypothetical protein
MSRWIAGRAVLIALIASSVSLSIAKEPESCASMAMVGADPEGISRLVREVQLHPSTCGITLLLDAAPASARPTVEALARGSREEFRSQLASQLDFARRAESDFAPRARRMVDALVAVAADSSVGEMARLEAVRLLFDIDVAPIAREALPSLRINLLASDSQLRSATERLLTAQGDPPMLIALQAECRRLLAAPAQEGSMEPSDTCLDPLARMGSDGKEALPLLVEHLRKVDGAARASLLETFGFLGDTGVEPLLVDYLQSEDERDVAASLISLWRLNAKARLPAIDLIARQHWYRPIRTLAANVAAALRGGSSNPITSALGYFPGSLTTNTHVGLARFGGKVPSRCGAWKYGEQVFSTPDDEARSIQIRPNAFAERFEKGVIVGTNWGEWGGNLQYVSDDGNATELVASNVAALRESYVDKGYIAVLGVAHMLDPGGEIVRIGFDDGVARVVARRRLPSAPERVYWDFNYANELIVMASGEGVLAGDDLVLKEATCIQPLPEVGE